MDRLEDAEIRLRPGDAVRLAAKDEPDVAGEFPVLDDGYAMLPLVGMIDVADRPFEEVEREIRGEYARELTEPDLVVTPVLRIAVLGEVRLPGLIPVDPTFTIGDVLAAAGGLTPNAAEDEVSVVRGSDIVHVELDPESTSLRMALRSGDQVIVGRRSWLSNNLPIFVSAAATVAAAAVTSLIVTR